ncbi:MAG: sodium:solute symporter family transporter [Gemmataceae bacterium]
MAAINWQPDSWMVPIVFACYLVGVVTLGIVSHRYLSRGSFVKEYFVGNRGLGPWVLALSVAATAISGGTFAGFPSLIYKNGWIMALWISSYMIVPLTTMALFGKRLNQVARMSGAVTVPDVFRDRFQSPGLGILATLILLLLLVFNLVAQFKAGALVMQGALQLPNDKLHMPLPPTFAVTTIEVGYLIGLTIFAATVVAYTSYGGFWAVTWNDVLQGLVMLTGVILMAFLAMRAVPPVTTTDGQELHGLAAATERLKQQDPALVYGPGPEVKLEETASEPGVAPQYFLPFGMAFSFFLMWSLMSPGQAGGMVRLMAFKDSASVRNALLLIAGYYLLTYMSMMIIFICARAIYPTQYLGEMGAEGTPDNIMPVMVRTVAPSWIAGLLLAAPYSAIMSTVAAFLLLISSSLVRDLYQRTINPNVSPKALKVASYSVTALVGLIVMVGALNPPKYLQYIIVFTGSGQGCAFLIPMALALYWRRATRAGVIAAMLGGFGTLLSLYVLGWIDSANWGDSLFAWLPGWNEPKLDKFSPLYLFGFDPLVWGLVVSIGLGIGVTLMTKPNEELVKKYYP